MLNRWLRLRRKRRPDQHPFHELHACSTVLGSVGTAGVPLPERIMHSATLPDDDLIEHEPEDCICGPTLQLVRDGNVYAWVLVHHRLDGR